MDIRNFCEEIKEKKIFYISAWGFDIFHEGYIWDKPWGMSRIFEGSDGREKQKGKHW